MVLMMIKAVMMKLATMAVIVHLIGKKTTVQKKGASGKDSHATKRVRTFHVGTTRRRMSATRPKTANTKEESSGTVRRTKVVATMKMIELVPTILLATILLA